MLQDKALRQIRLVPILVVLLYVVVLFKDTRIVLAGCDWATQCCSNYPGEYISKGANGCGAGCQRAGAGWTQTSDGDATQCIMHGYPSGECCVNLWYSPSCNGCSAGGVYPVMDSKCVSIDINGQNNNISLVTGGTYTAHVSMQNIGSRIRDGWNIYSIPYDWPTLCDGRDGNGEADVSLTNECPAVLVDVDSNGDKNATNIWGLRGGDWFGQPNFYRWGITSSNPTPRAFLGPGGIITYTFNFIAPAVGTYNFDYRMLKHIHPNDGAEWAPFGQVCSLPNVRVNPVTHTISGRLWITQNNCAEPHTTTGPILKNPNTGVVDLNNEHTYTGAIDTNKSYSIQNIPSGKSVTSLFVNNDPLNPPVDYNYVPTCFMTEKRANSGNGISFPAQIINTSVTGWDIGYKQVSTLDGWFTVQDGDIFTGSTLKTTMPTNPPIANQFSGYLIEKSASGIGGYVFSNANIDSATQTNISRVYQTNGGGYAKYLVGNMSSGISFWPDKYTVYKTPENTVPFTGSTMNATLNENTVYLVNNVDALNALNNITAETYSISNNGSAIILVTQPGTVTFKRNLRVNTGNSGRIIFVLSKGVNATIDRNVGYNVIIDGEPTAISRPNIEAAIVSTDANSNITFSGTTNEVTNPDNTVIMEGPIVAATTTLKRNKGENNSTPAEVIKYRSKYIYDLTNWERSSSVRKTGLFVTDIVYQYDN